MGSSIERPPLRCRRPPPCQSDEMKATIARLSAGLADGPYFELASLSLSYEPLPNMSTSPSSSCSTRPDGVLGELSRRRRHSTHPSSRGATPGCAARKQCDRAQEHPRQSAQESATASRLSSFHVARSFAPCFDIASGQRTPFKRARASLPLMCTSATLGRS